MARERKPRRRVRGRSRWEKAPRPSPAKPSVPSDNDDAIGPLDGDVDLLREYLRVIQRRKSDLSRMCLHCAWCGRELAEARMRFEAPGTIARAGDLAAERDFTTARGATREYPAAVLYYPDLIGGPQVSITTCGIECNNAMGEDILAELLRRHEEST